MTRKEAANLFIGECATASMFDLLKGATEIKYNLATVNSSLAPACAKLLLGETVTSWTMLA